MRRYGLSNGQWEQIKDLLSGCEGNIGGTASDNRLFVEAVLYRYCAGILRRVLSARFGDWRNVHWCLRLRCENGVSKWIFRQLTADHDSEYVMIDSTIFRAHQHRAGDR
ncbi:transposase [Acetobacter nitrogenifigens DSM 23921 = NBRC 105050]|uniref:IS5 family transposase n=1 Tax=Acetobacter nitrogenifigens DSM 23921 = NBRC 105050 TaxID=1120919 RepID=A0A511XF86_9PROT|nr:transposase [Acetobacter nitrogenifigens DSM 23921 = NBRC 105050]GEN61622.1 IS5 family transposase [Acetobacter nitrogenifigens DSM 23921 = NBRC 105050]